jgi:hypothetical protein
MEKTIINSKEYLDSYMHFCIGGSWDYKSDRYPEEYPCILIISKDRQSFGYVYKSELEALKGY